MKKDFYTALIAILLMFFINIIGSVINQYLNYYRNFKDLFILFPQLLLIGITYWILARIKINQIKKSIRLPIIRTIFWSGLLLIPILTNNRYSFMIGADFLLDYNSGICFPLATILIGLKNNSNIFFDILVIAFYEFIIFEIANKILNHITNKQLPTTNKPNAR